MASITAAGNGNWSATGTWVGGVVPVDGDEVEILSYIITLDVDINQPNTTVTATTGRLVYAGSGTRTVVLESITPTTGSNQGTLRMEGTGTLDYTGSVTGGSNSFGFGARNNSTGTLNVTTATGGSGSNAYGVHNESSGTVNVTTATGGSGSNAYGANNYLTGTANITTAIGGAGGHGAFNNAAGTMIVGLAVGNSWGPGGPHGTNCAGVWARNTVGQVTKVGAVQFGPYGASAIIGWALLDTTATNTAQFRVELNGDTETLVKPDYPGESDVRDGVQYGASGTELEGTLELPTTGDVRDGVGYGAGGTELEGTLEVEVVVSQGLTATITDDAFTVSSN